MGCRKILRSCPSQISHFLNLFIENESICRFNVVVSDKCRMKLARRNKHVVKGWHSPKYVNVHVSGNLPPHVAVSHFKSEKEHKLEIYIDGPLLITIIY